MLKIRKTSRKHSSKSIKHDLLQSCRLCGIIGGYRVPIIQETMTIGDDTSFAESTEIQINRKIQDCVSIEVKHGDKLPPLICVICLDKINDFYEFRRMCAETNIRLHKALGISIEKPQPVGMVVSTGDSNNQLDCILGVAGPVFFQPPAVNEAPPKIISSKKLKSVKKELKAIKNEANLNQKLEVYSVKKENVKKEPLVPMLKIKRPNKRERNRSREITKREKSIIAKAGPSMSLRVKTPIYTSSSELLQQHKTTLNSESSCLKNTKKKRWPFNCKICGDGYASSGPLHYHLIESHSPRVLQFGCTPCGEGFNSQDDFRDHHRWHKVNSVSYKCIKCLVTFSSYRIYTGHFDRNQCIHEYEAEDFNCNQCNQKYETRNLLLTHDCAAFKHDCQYCGRIFSKSRLAVSHEKNCQYSYANNFQQSTQDLEDQTGTTSYDYDPDYCLPKKIPKKSVRFLREARVKVENVRPQVEKPIKLEPSEQNIDIDYNYTSNYSHGKSRDKLKRHIKSEPVAYDENDEAANLGIKIEQEESYSEPYIKKELVHEGDHPAPKPHLKLKIKKEHGTLNSIIIEDDIETSHSTYNTQTPTFKQNPSMNDNLPIAITQVKSIHQDEFDRPIFSVKSPTFMCEIATKSLDEHIYTTPKSPLVVVKSEPETLDEFENNVMETDNRTMIESDRLSEQFSAAQNLTQSVINETLQDQIQRRNESLYSSSGIHIKSEPLTLDSESLDDHVTSEKSVLSDNYLNYSDIKVERICLTEQNTDQNVNTIILTNKKELQNVPITNNMNDCNSTINEILNSSVMCIKSEPLSLESLVTQKPTTSDNNYEEFDMNLLDSSTFKIRIKSEPLDLVPEISMSNPNVIEVGDILHDTPNDRLGFMYDEHSNTIDANVSNKECDNLQFKTSVIELVNDSDTINKGMLLKSIENSSVSETSEISVSSSPAPSSVLDLNPNLVDDFIVGNALNVDNTTDELLTNTGLAIPKVNYSQIIPDISTTTTEIHDAKNSMQISATADCGRDLTNNQESKTESISYDEIDNLLLAAVEASNIQISSGLNCTPPRKDYDSMKSSENENLEPNEEIKILDVNSSIISKCTSLSEYTVNLNQVSEVDNSHSECNEEYSRKDVCSSESTDLLISQYSDPNSLSEKLESNDSHKMKKIGESSKLLPCRKVESSMHIENICSAIDVLPAVENMELQITKSLDCIISPCKEMHFSRIILNESENIGHKISVLEQDTEMKVKIQNPFHDIQTLGSCFRKKNLQMLECFPQTSTSKDEYNSTILNEDFNKFDCKNEGKTLSSENLVNLEELDSTNICDLNESIKISNDNTESTNLCSNFELQQDCENSFCDDLESNSKKSDDMLNNLSKNCDIPLISECVINTECVLEEENQRSVSPTLLLFDNHTSEKQESGSENPISQSSSRKKPESLPNQNEIETQLVVGNVSESFIKTSSNLSKPELLDGINNTQDIQEFVQESNELLTAENVIVIKEESHVHTAFVDVHNQLDDSILEHKIQSPCIDGGSNKTGNQSVNNLEVDKFDKFPLLRSEGPVKEIEVDDEELEKCIDETSINEDSVDGVYNKTDNQNMNNLEVDEAEIFPLLRSEKSVKEIEIDDQELEKCIDDTSINEDSVDFINDFETEITNYTMNNSDKQLNEVETNSKKELNVYVEKMKTELFEISPERSTIPNVTIDDERAKCTYDTITKRADNVEALSKENLIVSYQEEDSIVKLDNVNATEKNYNEFNSIKDLVSLESCKSLQNLQKTINEESVSDNIESDFWETNAELNIMEQIPCEVMKQELINVNKEFGSSDNNLLDIEDRGSISNVQLATAIVENENNENTCTFQNEIKNDCMDTE